MGYGKIDARGGDPLLNGFMTTGLRGALFL